MLDINDLSIDRSGQPVLRHVSLHVPTGQTVALLGPNGAGKTTLLRTISGLLRARSGSIVLDGRTITNLIPRDIVKAGIVHVPQGREVFAKLTVTDNLRLGAFTRDRSVIDNALEEMFERFPVLGDRRQQPAGLLSGGEQQMLVIARALIASPRLLMLDEPSLGLAPLIVAQVTDIVEEIQGQGTTVLIVEQQTEIAVKLASQVSLLVAGKIVLSGSTDDFSGRQELIDSYLGVATLA